MATGTANNGLECEVPSDDLGREVFSDVTSNGLGRDAIRSLSNDALMQRLKELNQRKHLLDAELLLYLGELDRRWLYREHACSSLFAFCVSRLGFSEEVAYKRVGAARMIRDYPLVYELLREGRLHLSALMLIRPHLTAQNHRAWLLSACGKTKREVEVLVASRCPSPNVPTRVRKLPDRQLNSSLPVPVVGNGQPTGATAPASSPEATLVDAGALVTSPMATAPAMPLALPTTTISPKGNIKPLSVSNYRVVFTASDSFKRKMDHAAALVSHSIDPGNVPALLERAIDLLIAQEEKRRFAVGVRRTATGDATRSTVGGADRTRNEALAETRVEVTETTQDELLVDTRMDMRENVGLDPDPDLKHGPCHADHADHADCGVLAASVKRRQSKNRSRNFPADVRRAVWHRDGGQCAFVDTEGNRCSERRYLEFDHREPFALGGGESLDNCRLYCSAHNALAAAQVFGRSKIDGEFAEASRAR